MSATIFTILNSYSADNTSQTLQNYFKHAPVTAV